MKALIIVLALALGTAAYAQGDAAADLRTRLRDRYDVLSLQDGVGLVPRSRDAGIRIIEIRNGAVSIDGMTATGDQLRMRLGADADLILRVSYLDAAQQRQLAGDAPPPVDAPPGATSPPPVPPVPENRPPRARRGEEIVRFGNNVTIDRDEVVDGEVVVIFGNATVNGEIDGELTVVMGNADLGPEAVVRDDVTVVGGTLNRAPGAVIEGRIQNVAVGDGDWRGAGFPGMVRDTMFRNTIGRVGSFVGTLLRIGLLSLLAVAIVAFGRNSIERIAERASADPLRSGLTGFLGQVLFAPILLVTIFILLISIIGIPLLLLVPFGVMLLVVVAIVGFTGVAYYVGSLLAARFGWTDRGSYVAVLLGVLAIALITLVARATAIIGGGLFAFPLTFVGYVVEYLAWTLGFGAAILAWHQHWRMRRQAAVS
jgi:hypothetical protein